MFETFLPWGGILYQVQDAPLNTIALKDDFDDITCWTSFKKGDRDAFSALFSRYYPLLYQYGSKICPDLQVLEDCIQDLFVEIWQSTASLQVVSVKAYLLRSLKYKIYKLHRRQHPLQSADTALENMSFEINREDFLVTREEEYNRVARVTEAIRQLPARQKEMVYLKVFKGLEYEEISEIMNINYQVCRNLFHQAIKSLRQLLHAK